jgi:hypothetical protein
MWLLTMLACFAASFAYDLGKITCISAARWWVGLILRGRCDWMEGGRKFSERDEGDHVRSDE